MRDHEKVIVVPNVFTPDECNALIAELDEKELEAGTIYRKFDEEYRVVVCSDTRDCVQYRMESPLTEFVELRQRLHDLGRKINDEHFHFNLDGFPYDRMVYVRYDDGGFFGPHKDAFGTEEIGFRKLSMSLQLSPDEDFEGGDIYISPYGVQEMSQGDVVIFPPYMIHHVTPVKGVRKVIVNWCCSGTPFQ